jgi:uncharacterized protein YegL
MPFPNVQLYRRPLHFIYICDCSGSMQARGKIQALNQAIRASLPGMAAVARDNPEARLLVRVLTFADQARWHLAEPTPVEELEHRWSDLQSGGLTAMGQAMELLAAALDPAVMDQRALPPVLVLISDGAPTDDYDAGLAALLRQPWARKAVRLALAIGHDADEDDLQKFIGSVPTGFPDAAGQLGEEAPGRRPLQANDASTLARYIRWASTAVVGAASRPLSQLGALTGAETPLPLPDLPPTLIDPIDTSLIVW